MTPTRSHPLAGGGVNVVAVAGREGGAAATASPFEPADPSTTTDHPADCPDDIYPDPDLDPVDPWDEALWDGAAAAPVWEQKPLQV